MTDSTETALLQEEMGGPSERNATPGFQLSSKWRFANVVLLGVAFMLLFTAFQTSSMMEESVLESARNHSNGTFSGSGYTSLSIIYGVFAASNWLAPSVVAVCGPKWSMVLGGIAYCLFIASFLKPMTWALYVGSVLVGLGAAVIWIGQGNFLTINSDPSTIGRNSGVFWALLQVSLLAGNLYVYLAFDGQVTISEHARFQLFAIFTVLGVAGVIVLFLLRMPPKSLSNQEINSAISSRNESPLLAFKRCFRLLITRNMLLLCLCFAYTGFELTFWSGVYGTSVGHTQHFGSHAKQLIGLSGIFIGLGEIIGGLLFGLLGKKTNSFGRDPIILLGFCTHIVAFYLIFINLPSDSPLKETLKATFLPANEYVAIVSAFLLGFGDSSFNTQIFSILGAAYADQSASAFALYKFVQSLASAVAFGYSSYLLLHWQLLIMVVFCAVGTLSFFTVEWSVSRSPSRQGYTAVSTDDNS